MHITVKHIVALATLLFFAFISKAQNSDAITFEATLSKDMLGINERLRIDFSMNKDGDNFNPPNFEGFNVVMGPSQSISSSWVNGVRSYSKTYSYVLMPTARGKFTINQATIVIDGKTYKSLPLEVEITAAVERPGEEASADAVADDNLHLVAEVSKTGPYLNEAITVVYKLFVSPTINVSNFRALDNPKYNNFWSQEMPVTKYSVQNGIYEGQTYRYVILKRVVLYPQKTGELEIEPLSLEVTVDVPTNKRDFFGGKVYTSTNITVSAGQRNIMVKELPTAGKPENFGGAVGAFNFSVTTTKTELNASESLQAKVEVRGKGNLKLFQLPELNLPSALEVYEPEFNEGIRTTIDGMEGTVSNSYTIVPSFKGKYPIPGIKFSYFDPETEKYRSLTSKEIMINVIDGPNSGPVNTAGPASYGNQKSVVATGDQFNFIKTRSGLKALTARSFFGSTSFYLWFLLPLLLIPLAIIFGKKREAIGSDLAGNKIKKANRLAKKYLSAAKKTLGNKEAFYIALEKALHNYLKAKLKIETSEFSKDKIEALLAEKQIEENSIQDFISLLKNCELARYSPFSEVQMQDDYDKASEVISQMDKQL
ncbi:BatD family protein [Flavobacteriaceae bacterium KMM 6897]|nr:BatD family protein [Flavobacteriaceae bacterium KMM 6897]